MPPASDRLGPDAVADVVQADLADRVRVPLEQRLQVYHRGDRLARAVGDAHDVVPRRVDLRGVGRCAEGRVHGRCGEVVVVVVLAVWVPDDPPHAARPRASAIPTTGAADGAAAPWDGRALAVGLRRLPYGACGDSAHVAPSVSRGSIITMLTARCTANRGMCASQRGGRPGPSGASCIARPDRAHAPSVARGPKAGGASRARPTTTQIPAPSRFSLAGTGIRRVIRLQCTSVG